MVTAAIIIVVAIGGLCLYISIKKDHEQRTDPDNLDNVEDNE